MKNIINDKPKDILNGRCLFSADFVDDNDIKNSIILNIGCGYGWFELNCIKRNADRIYGIEISEKDLWTAKNNISNEKVVFQVGTAIEIPYKNNFFDTITSWEVIEHIPQNTEQKMFREVNRVLKDNGVFYLSTPFKNFFSNMFDPAWYFGHRHYSIEFIKKLAEENGFKIEKLVTKGGFWVIFGTINMYVSKWIFGRKPFFDYFINNKKNREYLKNGISNIFIKMRKVKNL